MKVKRALVNNLLYGIDCLLDLLEIDEGNTDIHNRLIMLSGMINNAKKHIGKDVITMVRYEKSISKFTGTFLMITDFLEDNQRLELIELLKQTNAEAAVENDINLTSFLDKNQSDLKPVKIINALMNELDVIEKLLHSVESISTKFYLENNSNSGSQRDNYFYQLNRKYLRLTDISKKLFNLEKLFLEYSYRNASLEEIPEPIVGKCFDLISCSASFIAKYRAMFFPIGDRKDETSFRKVELKILDEIMSVSDRVSETKSMIQIYLVKTKTFEKKDYDPSMFINIDYLMQASLKFQLNSDHH